MNPFAAYRAVNTKLHCKKRVFVKKDEWIKLAGFQNVTQLVDFLKNRIGDEEIFSMYKTSDLHRGDLEVILDRYVVHEIEEMLHYYSGSYLEFFKMFLMEYEINDLTRLLRAIIRKEDTSQIDKYFVHSKQYSKCNYERLKSCTTIAQFIEALKGTDYYDALKTMTADDVAKREFHMEMKSYVLFYKLLMERAKKLKTKDYELVKQIVGKKIDLINVQWIFRATKYYAITPEEILIYSLPYGNKLSYKKLKTLSYAKNLETFKKLTVSFLREAFFDQEDDIYIERTLDETLYEYVAHLGVDGEDLAMSLSYIYLLQIEVKDLISLTEGIRYHLPIKDIGKYLVHTI